MFHRKQHSLTDQDNMSKYKKTVCRRKKKYKPIWHAKRKMKLFQNYFLYLSVMGHAFILPNSGCYRHDRVNPDPTWLLER